jgi:hypothetical protein
MNKHLFRLPFTAFMVIALAMTSAIPGRAQDSSSAPLTISASANGTNSTIVEQGWPLLVTVQIINAGLSEDVVTPIVVSGGAGSWSDAVSLAVTDTASSLVSWPFHPAFATTGDLTVDADSSGELWWWLSPEETALLPPGVYLLTAAIDSSAVADPFKNFPRATSVPVTITVGAGGTRPAGAPTSGAGAADPFLLVHYYIVRGEDSTALAVIDQLLATDTANVGGLGYRAELLREMGSPREAMAAYTKAVEAYFQSPHDTTEPPFQLLEGYYSLQAEIAAYTSFDVTVGTKTASHPYYEAGYTDGFLIDGVEGEELWLLEDTAYTFRMSNVPAGTPFYFTTDTAGNGNAAYTDGVTGSPASGDGEITITPGPGSPATLYYQATTQSKMGWRIHIVRDSVFTGVEPSSPSIPGEYELSLAYPNPFNPETRFTLTLRRQQRVTIAVYDASGRLVLKLFDGQLPGSVSREFTIEGEGLASGAYLVRIQGDHFSAVRRIVLLK